MTRWRRLFVERRRVLLPLAVLLLVNVLALAAVIVPLRSLVTSAEQQSYAATTDLARARQRLREAQTARTSRDRAQQELQTFYAQVLPKNEAAAVAITYVQIDHIARETGLSADRRDFTPERVKDSRLGRFSTEATLVGTYGDIRRFLYEIETAEPFLVIDAVALAPARGSTVTSDVLQVSVTISTYYLAAE